jgi:hypothetical protein
VAEHVVPPGVQVLLEIVVGNQWPEGNEGDLRAMAANWRDAGTLVNDLVDGTRSATAQVDAAIQAGTARGEIDAVLHGLTDGDQAYLPKLASVCTSLGDALDTMALEIETLRIEIITQLVILAAEIAIDLALAPFTFGASEGAAVAETAATRVAVNVLIRKTVIKLIAHLAESEFNQVGLDFFAQFIEICQHRRTGFDTNELKTAAINGAVGGAVGFGMGGLGSLVKNGLGKGLGDHLPGFEKDRPTSWKEAGGFGAGVLFDGGWGAASGAAEASAQDAALGGSGDTTGGAMNGAFSGFKAAGHTALNPDDKVSLSAGHYFDTGLNHAWDKAFPTPQDDHSGTHTPDEGFTTPPPDQAHSFGMPDGSTVTAFPDSSHTITYADGSSVHTQPGGPNVSSHPDGSHVVHNPDGSTVTTLPDGNNVVTLPDGSTRIYGPDEPNPLTAPGAWAASILDATA